MRTRTAIAVLSATILIGGTTRLHAQNVAAGTQHSVVAKPDGTVWAWGYNLFGGVGVTCPPKTDPAIM